MEHTARNLLQLARQKQGEFRDHGPKGELFNLLTIINRGHLEVMTHSPILAELLSPSGSHEHGDVFLCLFLEQMELAGFEPEGSRVVREQSYGYLGRIDLVLTDSSGKNIFIENKIYAGLQERQLERYQEVDPAAVILYLTLEGSLPDKATLATVPNLRPISYRGDIVAWLHRCEKAAVGSHLVRESIVQYRNLVLLLTNQNLSHPMTKQLADAALADRETFLAFDALVCSGVEVTLRLGQKLTQQVRDELGQEVEFSEVVQGNGKALDGFAFQITTVDGGVLDAQFSFETQNYRNCFFGFRCSGTLSTEDEELLKEAYEREFTEKSISHPKWPRWSHWHDRDWTARTWAQVIDSTVLALKVAETLRRLKKVGMNFVKVRADRTEGAGLPS